MSSKVKETMLRSKIMARILELLQTQTMRTTNLQSKMLLLVASSRTQKEERIKEDLQRNQREESRLLNFGKKLQRRGEIRDVNQRSRLSQNQSEKLAPRSALGAQKKGTRCRTARR
jgi:hypothetical protein